MATVPKTKKAAAPPREEIKWPFGKRNYIAFGVALTVIIFGYISLGQGSITLAPILLFLGYCVLVPVAILIKDPDIEKSDSPDSSSGV
jgi:hypothetical protein